MKGEYKIRLWDSRVSYNLLVNRKVTVVSGNSGTGKTTFYGMVSLYYELGKSSGVSLICNKELVPITKGNYEKISGEDDKIFVADENFSELTTEYFARLVKDSGSYFILISRNPLGCLSYSLSAMVGITSKKDLGCEYTENLFYSIYSDSYEIIKPSFVITEDEKSGKDFFKASLNVPVETANGAPGILQKLKNSLGHSNICIIIDREGFGPYIKNIEGYLKENNLLDKVKILAPRSFEYLLLKSIFYSRVENEIEKTYDFCDAKEFNSWEIYYEDLLRHVSVDSGVSYSKAKINLYFIKNRRKVLSELEISDELWR